MGNIRVTLGPLWFSSKTDAINHVKKYLKGPPRRVDAKDEIWVLPLLKRHPRWEEKSKGYSHVVVRKNGNANCFYVVTEGGHEEDFSYKYCISPESYNKRPTHEATVAMRLAVKNQCESVKDDAFRNAIAMKCPVLGIDVTREESHTDHTFSMAGKRFHELRDAFLKAEGLALKDVRTQNLGDGVSVFEDSALEGRWCAFHKENAVLRVISKAANLKGA